MCLRFILIFIRSFITIFAFVNELICTSTVILMCAFDVLLILIFSLVSMFISLVPILLGFGLSCWLSSAPRILLLSRINYRFPPSTSLFYTLCITCKKHLPKVSLPACTRCLLRGEVALLRRGTPHHLFIVSNHEVFTMLLLGRVRCFFGMTQNVYSVRNICLFIRRGPKRQKYV